MPELVVDFITSLDGYASAGWPGWRGLEGPEYLAWLGQVLGADGEDLPVITGATGRDRIYDGYPGVALDMTESRTFDGQIRLVEYAPTVLDGPPSAP